MERVVQNPAQQTSFGGKGSKTEFSSPERDFLNASYCNDVQLLTTKENCPARTRT
jgi:hypothetical protein